jgi:hypothetical protein
MKYLYTVRVAMARETGPKTFKCMTLGDAVALSKQLWKRAVAAELPGGSGC